MVIVVGHAHTYSSLCGLICMWSNRFVSSARVRSRIILHCSLALCRCVCFPSLIWIRSLGEEWETKTEVQWVHTSAVFYLIIIINNRKWVMSDECARKTAEQLNENVAQPFWRFRWVGQINPYSVMSTQNKHARCDKMQSNDDDWVTVTVTMKPHVPPSKLRTLAKAHKWEIAVRD